MASTYGTPVAFTKEKNVWTLSARVVFNPSGVAVLDTSNSKGICAVNSESIAFTGGVVNSTTTIGSISSYAGLFPGMTITGSGVATSQVISSTMAAASTGTITVAKQNITTADEVALQATGGRYQFQFGQEAAKRLDTYVKLLGVQVSWDESTSSAIGTATSLALAPAGPEAFVVKNNISIRTIPQTTTTGSTDASISLQFGYGRGVLFNAATPQTGESCRVVFVFGNSTAP